MASVHLQLITFSPDGSDTLTVFLQTLSHLRLFDAVKNTFLLQQTRPNVRPNRGGANSQLKGKDAGSLNAPLRSGSATTGTDHQNFVIDAELLVIEGSTCAQRCAAFQATSARRQQLFSQLELQCMLGERAVSSGVAQRSLKTRCPTERALPVRWFTEVLLLSKRSQTRPQR